MSSQRRPDFACSTHREPDDFQWRKKDGMKRSRMREQLPENQQPDERRRHEKNRLAGISENHVPVRRPEFSLCPRRCSGLPLRFIGRRHEISFLSFREPLFVRFEASILSGLGQGSRRGPARWRRRYAPACTDPALRGRIFLSCPPARSTWMCSPISAFQP